MAKYKFEQIAINSTEKKKPVEQDRFAYIGLEHMDPGCLNVTRFGTEVAPVGEKLIMHKGDVLFGKRRAYQKKVAIAPFDGIFSAHGMVLRPREDIIDRRFFPLFIGSDYFLDAAIKISVGSLSPTINWRDLKELEFELPDLDRQRKLAEVLWAINDAVESYKKLLDATDKLVKARFEEMFEKSVNKMTMEEVCLIITDGTHQQPKFCKDGIPFIFVSNIAENKLTYNAEKFISDDTYNELIKRTPIEVGDVLLSTVGSYGHAAVVTEERKFLFQRHIAYLKPNRKFINGFYLHNALLAPNTQRQIEERVRGIAQKTLNLSEIRTIKIPVPDMDKQNKYVNFVHQTDKSKSELEQALSELTATYKRILSENLG